MPRRITVERVNGSWWAWFSDAAARAAVGKTLGEAICHLYEEHEMTPIDLQDLIRIETLGDHRIEFHIREEN